MTDQPMAASDSTADALKPSEVYEQMERYLKETESLLSLLRESLAKGEDQLIMLTTFDTRAPQLNSQLTPIDTATLQAEIQDVRQRISSLEELRDRVKADLEKVKEISQKIGQILDQYKTP
jgi:DNA-directed RNA polymerase subunit L